MSSEKAIQQEIEKLKLLQHEVGKVIVGQQEVLEQLLISLMAGGHALLEGVPGLAKTLMVRSLSQAMDLSFNRIQFTPDLMPSDIIGTEILREQANGQKGFEFVKGPIFSNIILADEINRTPPKTQAALLEAMQEFSVTYGGKNYPLQTPFFILATQNPIEQAGTYPLPEAQLDRFLLYIQIDYPNEQEEVDILTQTTGTKKATIQPVIDGKSILHIQDLVRQVSISSDLVRYVSQLIRATRPQTTHLPSMKEWISWGAGPRAGQALILCSKARALLKGRFAVIPEDIKAMSHPVLRHRILINFKAESENVQVNQVIDRLLEKVNLPKKKF